MWREHGALRSTDPEAQSDPALLGDALFMHRLTTGARRRRAGRGRVPLLRIRPATLPMSRPSCARCDPLDRTTTSCLGRLAFGNYEFSLSASYNHEACTEPVSPKRREEFARTMQTADRLIRLYLEPLRRKPSWL